LILNKKVALTLLSFTRVTGTTHGFELCMSHTCAIGRAKAVFLPPVSLYCDTTEVEFCSCFISSY